MLCRHQCAGERAIDCDGVAGVFRKCNRSVCKFRWCVERIGAEAEVGVIGGIDLLVTKRQWDRRKRMAVQHKAVSVSFQCLVHEGCQWLMMGLVIGVQQQLTVGSAANLAEWLAGGGFGVDHSKSELAGGFVFVLYKPFRITHHAADGVDHRTSDIW